MRRSFACALSLSVLSTLIVGGLPGPPAAAAPGAAEPPAEGHTVTLITGDRVRLDGAGRAQRATVVRTAPGTTSFLTYRERDHLYVVPDQAAGPLGDGRLDRRLFDLTGLVAAGYDDRARTSLPLIIGYDTEQRLRAQALPAGTARIRDLPSVAGSAVAANKPDLDEFWARTAQTAEVTRIWLDGPVRGALDRSVAQIGGPAAWTRGYTGAGVKVAVLDTGLDAGHPDFAGRVGASANFTTEPDTEDRLGHGTHVASIALGSGAGSGGTYRGVAPDATLLVGKVLERRIVHPGIPVGVGTDSWIIAGMEWAAAQGAQVVNLSLGGLPGNGDDPMSAAVNRLTAASGALFVVAAGNSGSDGPYSVGTPAVADAALAVGNVDRDDSLNWTSSLGPRPGDDAIKPEITAPGTQITAAWNGGPDGPRYRALSGTSMASPHVAGAAALLKQQHPDWTAERLRAALTSTAAANPTLDVHSQGAGRLDVDRASAQQVHADTGVANLGYFAKGANPRATKRITYRNDTTAPVTLDLAASGRGQDGNPIPAGMLTAGAAKVTVPAGGTAPVDLTVDVSAGGPGNYGGTLTATGPDGLRIGTAIAFTKQGDFVDVTFRGLDRNGNPTAALVSLQNLAPPNQMSGQYLFIAPTGSRTVRMPAGRYAMFGHVRTMDASGRFVAHNTVALDPELEVDQHNFTVTLDARKGRDLGVRVPREADLEAMSIGMEVNRPNLPWPYQGAVSLARGERALGPPMRAVPMSILPFDPPRDATVNVDTEWHLRAPVVRAEIRHPRHAELHPVRVRNSVPVTGRSTVDVVDAGAGRPEDVRGKDLRGKAAVVRETPGLTFDEQAQVVSEAGARFALISSAQPGLFDGVLRLEAPPMPVLAISQADGDRLRAGRRTTVEIWGHETAPYRYDLLFRDTNRLPASMVKTVDHWRLAEVRTGYHTLGPTKGARMSSRRSPDYASPCGYCGFVLPQPDGEVTGLEEFAGALSRPEYVTPGVDWREDLFPVGMGSWSSAIRSYRTGTTGVAWQRAPVAAGVPMVPGMRSERAGDQLRFRLGAFTDSDPTHWARARFIPRQPVRLYRDGVEAGSCGDEGGLLCDLDVKPGAASYELRATILGDAFSWDVGQKSETAWTFRSDTAAAPAALPLIDVDYLFPVDGEQAARADRWFVGGITARHQPGSTAPRVRSMTLSVSYDDGATWRPARVDRLYGEQFLVSYRHPELAGSNGFVALRLEAADSAGNKLEQTVYRAYRLR